MSGSLLLVFLCTAAMGQDKGLTAITAGGDTLVAYSLDSLTNESLYMKCGAANESVPIDSVETLIRHGRSHFWSGAWIGSGTGALVGFIAAYASYEEPKGPIAVGIGPGGEEMVSAILGAAAGFIIGGVIGAVSEPDEVYHLSSRSHQYRVTLMRFLLSKQ